MIVSFKKVSKISAEVEEILISRREIDEGMISGFNAVKKVAQELGKSKFKIEGTRPSIGMIIAVAGEMIKVFGEGFAGIKQDAAIAAFEVMHLITKVGGKEKVGVRKVR